MSATGRNEELRRMTSNDNYDETIDLARHTNAILPISELPDSVLAEIFDCYRNLHPTEELIILQITHVCHSWRAIASSYGRLWTDIFVVCPDQVQHWLARSAYCLLDVEAYVYDDEYGDLGERSSRDSERDALCLVLEELPRIRTLELSCLDVNFTIEQLSRYRWTNPPAPSPFLQSLNIKASAKTYSRDLDNFFSATVLFLNRDLPSLTHLSIVDSRSFLNNVRFPPSLKHLQICDMNPAADWDTNIASAILAVLDALPSLESLRLTWSRVDDEDFPGPAVPSVERQVTLPHLRKLEMRTRTPPDMCTCLLNHLRFPSTTQIQVQAGHGDELERKSFLETVALKLDGRDSIGNKRPLRSFVISCNIFDADMAGWCDAHPPESFGTREPDIRIKLDDESPGPEIDLLGESTHIVCTTFPLSKVEILTLRHVCLDIEPPTLMTISQNMPALHTLHIDNWSYQHQWPKCLFHVASWDINELFPSLKNIYLETLSHRRFFEDERIGFWEFLVQFLVARKRRGASIEKLTVRACGDVNADRRKLLQGLVDKLIWEPTGRDAHDHEYASDYGW